MSEETYNESLIRGYGDAIKINKKAVKMNNDRLSLSLIGLMLGLIYLSLGVFLIFIEELIFSLFVFILMSLVSIGLTLYIWKGKYQAHVREREETGQRSH